jgi:putative peptidoglycan lipid II flippase
VEGPRTLGAAAQMLGAAALLGGVAYGVWYGLDDALGRGLVAQIVSVLTALAAGFAVYTAAVLALRLPEAIQIRRLLVSRGRSSG